jgi:hypothetical protein
LIAEIGESFVLNFNTYIDPGSSGLNQVWDLTGGIVSQQALFEYVSVESTPFASSYTNSSYCTRSSNVGQSNYAYTYFSTDGTADYFDGLAYTGTVINYNDPQKFWQFPIEYGDSFEDYFESTFESGVTWFRSVTSSYTVDGYGTLILPYGTLENVYRVKTVQDYSDEAIAEEIILDYNVEYYSYVKAGTHNYIASVQSIEVEQTGQLSQYTYIMDESSVGIPEFNSLNNEIIIAPNPVLDIARITVENHQNENILIELVDITGRTIEEIGIINSAFDNSLSHDFSRYNAGMYLVKISTDKGFAVKKLILN